MPSAGTSPLATWSIASMLAARERADQVGKGSGSGSREANAALPMPPVSDGNWAGSTSNGSLAASTNARSWFIAAADG